MTADQRLAAAVEYPVVVDALGGCAALGQPTCRHLHRIRLAAAEAEHCHRDPLQGVVTMAHGGCSWVEKQ